MKKSIIISLLIASIATALTAKEVVETPVEVEFADKLVSVFGGEDNVLSHKELVRVMDFIQNKLPEKTGPAALTTRLSRQNNVANAARGDMSEERNILREDIPEKAAVVILEKYDANSDNYVTKSELANALTNVIGTPKAKAGYNKGSVAQR